MKALSKEDGILVKVQWLSVEESRVCVRPLQEEAKISGRGKRRRPHLWKRKWPREGWREKTLKWKEDKP